MRFDSAHYFCVKTDKKVVALTFDDGPDPLYTPKILDTLKKFNVKATFFVLGVQAEKYPQLIQRIYKEGHELGNHSYSHARLIFKLPSFVRREIESTDKIIRDQSYTGPIHFRAPYGNKLIVLPWILQQMNSINAMGEMITQTRRLGYEFLTISELLNNEL